MQDTLKIYDILKEAQIPELQARAITRAIQESGQKLATDLKEILTEKLDEFATKFALKTDLLELKSELMRWMFIFWVGQMAATVGIIFAAFRIWH